MADVAGRNVEVAQFRLKVLGMVHERQEVDEGNKLSVIEPSGDKLA